MSRLRVYTVHINPALPHPYEGAEFIEEGFSWRAFLFTGLWALYNQLWLVLLFILFFNAFLMYISDSEISASGIISVQLGINIIIGYLANDWKRGKLKKKGFIIADIVTGSSIITAEQRFFDRYFNAAPHPVSPVA